MEYKFNKKRYLTKGVNESIPMEVQKFLWGTIDQLVLKEVDLDYLQIFRIRKDNNMLTIIHNQEEPVTFRMEYQLLDIDFLNLTSKEIKIYIIDNHDHSIMLLADEY